MNIYSTNYKTHTNILKLKLYIKLYDNKEPNALAKKLKKPIFQIEFKRFFLMNELENLESAALRSNRLPG